MGLLVGKKGQNMVCVLAGHSMYGGRRRHMVKAGSEEEKEGGRAVIKGLGVVILGYWLFNFTLNCCSGVGWVGGE